MNLPLSPASWRTRPAHSLFRHYFRDFCRSCAALARYRRRGAAMRPLVDAAEAAIAARLLGARRHAESLSRKARRLLVEPEAAQAFEARGHRTLPQDFLAALRIADEALALLERCQRQGLCDPHPRWRDDLMLRRNLRAVPALARAQRIQLLQRCARNPQAADWVGPEARRLIEQDAAQAEALGAPDDTAGLQRLSQAPDG